ncbi:hypothetical protein VM1G_10849 [Cytospora mali]|uniref:Uncharacterized protein n=1 Tax=Cytospora mali TaxID=578113 RepID=A0A194VIW3_CYTMA|nr:hypothetical protein VM1G_10849 [Valsa mali]
MAAVVEEQSRPEADHDVEFTDDTVNTNHDEEFDFDIGGPEDNLDTEAGAESTNEGLAYRVEGSGTFDSSYTYEVSDEGAQQPVEDSYDPESHDHTSGQDVFETSGFDIAVENENLGEEFSEHVQGDHLEENKNVHQMEQGQYQQFEVHGDEISYEETAVEFEGLDNAAQPDAEQAYGTMDTTASVEYADHEEEHFKAHSDAQDENGAQVEGDRELLPEGNPSNEMGETEVTMATDSNEKGSVSDIGVHADAEDDAPVTQQTADSVDESAAAADWDEDGYENQQHPDEQPTIRVFWRTEEFRLFADSPDDDPDTYFLKGLDSLQQPLSQFLSGLRQVIANELAPSEELVVKVDGLGLEFGETTTADFLEKTTFGQILNLHTRLLELDDGSESHELYLYLDARPSCLHRFDELTKGTEEGLGLSHFAFYYEDASTDKPADENDEDQLEGPQDTYSDDISINESYDEQQGDNDENDETEQLYNPFRVTETQRLEVETQIETAPSSGAVEEGDEEHSAPAEAADAHSIDDAVGEADIATVEDQDGLDLETAETLDDVPVDDNMQGTIPELDEVKDIGTEELGGDYGDGGDDEQDIANDEVVRVETNADVLEGDPRDIHDPTDDHDAADNDDYLDLDNDDVDATDDKPFEDVEHSGTPDLTTHDSSATATLDGEDHSNGDGAPRAQDYADASHAVEASTQPDVNSSHEELDEIDWKEGEDEDEEDDAADQNPTTLSPSSISVKRSRQEDEDGDGLGDESTVKRRRTEVDNS